METIRTPRRTKPEHSVWTKKTHNYLFFLPQNKKKRNIKAQKRGVEVFMGWGELRRGFVEKLGAVTKGNDGLVWVEIGFKKQSSRN
jgi:hypothetical protein